MKLDTRLTILLIGIIVLFLWLLSGCTNHHHPDPPVVSYQVAPSGVISARFHGRELSAGGYYAIASCTGVDDLNNVDTRVGDGTMLRARQGTCAPTPWSFESVRTGTHTLRIKLRIGPMGNNYATLSVPFDLFKHEVSEYEFSEGKLFVSTGFGEQPQASAVGTYAAIPTPFTIPVLPPPNNRVGFVRSRRPLPWIEARTQGGVHVRRTFYDGPAYKEVYVYNHPATNNIEASFGAVKKGQVVTLEEEITIY